jgi:gamma-glutamylcyclotransferase (GGCT)/AIG2-like uncharacterized protein YtfP
MTFPLFVYGSLRTGLINNHKLHSATYQGFWCTSNEYYMIGIKSGSYPYVTDENIHNELLPTKIYGELYYINEEMLKSIDEMEGHPTQYRRHIVDIINDKQKQTAYMYLLVNEELKNGIRENFERRFIAVNTGDWLDYKIKH